MAKAKGLLGEIDALPSTNHPSYGWADAIKNEYPDFYDELIEVASRFARGDKAICSKFKTRLQFCEWLTGRINNTTWLELAAQVVTTWFDRNKVKWRKG